MESQEKNGFTLAEIIGQDKARNFLEKNRALLNKNRKKEDINGRPIAETRTI